MKFRKICAFLFVFAAPAAQAADFHGYPCTQDCSGHKAGYEWAERNGIADPDDCGGNSNSFIEGCMAWAEEQGADSSYEAETERDDWDHEQLETDPF